jgi:glycosyltransferase involved in cell wall biosynthesis
MSAAGEKRFVIALVHSSDIHSGGASNYEASLQELLANLSEEMGFELKTFYRTGSLARKQSRAHTSKGAHWYSFGLSEKFAIWMIRSEPGRELLKVLGINNLRFERRLKREKVDVVYFASPNALAMGLTEIPFITTVWDLGHRDVPQYPEVSVHGRWETREAYYRATVPKSLFVVSDSTATGKRLESIYGISEERWLALGLLPRRVPVESLSILGFDVNLVPFVYYPAHKWAHKNHLVLFRALKLLTDSGTEVKLVLSGIDKGFGANLESSIEELGIQDYVVDLGFRDEDEVTFLMMNSKAVLMPSLVGPTNLPPLEACLLGVPAIVSDIHSFDEESARHFLHVDAFDPKAWADAIRLAITGINGQVGLDGEMILAEARIKILQLIESCRRKL